MFNLSKCHKSTTTRLNKCNAHIKTALFDVDGEQAFMVQLISYNTPVVQILYNFTLKNVHCAIYRYGSNTTYQHIHKFFGYCANSNSDLLKTFGKIAQNTYNFGMDIPQRPRPVLFEGHLKNIDDISALHCEATAYYNYISRERDFEKIFYGLDGHKQLFDL